MPTDRRACRCGHRQSNHQAWQSDCMDSKCSCTGFVHHHFLLSWEMRREISKPLIAIGRENIAMAKAILRRCGVSTLADVPMSCYSQIKNDIREVSKQMKSKVVYGHTHDAPEKDQQKALVGHYHAPLQDENGLVYKLGMWTTRFDEGSGKSIAEILPGRICKHCRLIYINRDVFDDLKRKEEARQAKVANLLEMIKTKEKIGLEAYRSYDREQREIRDMKLELEKLQADK